MSDSEPVPEDGEKFVDDLGHEYEIDPDFTEGDIVLLTDPEQEGYAFRIYKASLANASPVFRDMFSGPFEGSHVLLDTDDNTLDPFLQFLIKPQLPWQHTWRKTFIVLELAQTYQCDAYIRDLIYTAASKDPGKDRFEAFIWAARYDHLTAACRLLRWAGSGELLEKKGKSLRPNTAGWTPQDVARLPNQWLWALSCGVQWADQTLSVPESSVRRQKEDYWKVVVGEFMIRMTM